MKLGSFFFPLIGMGARKGLSVSIISFSFGIDAKVFLKSDEFLKVIIPLAEKYEFSFNNFFENS